MSDEAEYILSAYSIINKLPLDKLLEVGNQIKNENPIPSFDEKLLIDLCSSAQSIFEKEENILEIHGDLIVVGDIHGSFHDLLRILKYIDENNSKVLFLGDYVDRGEFSLECITLLFAMKILHQDKFFLIRGNHEFDSLCSQYGFKKEILNHHNPRKIHILQPTQNTKKKKVSNIFQFNFEEEEEEEEKPTEQNYREEYYENRADSNCYKYSLNLYDAFMKAFSYLPICSLVNNTIFCVHGGLSPYLDKIDILKTAIQRPVNTFEENKLLSDLMWSDPSKHTDLFSENHRGRGCLFNYHVVFNFLKKNSLSRIIRAHECVANGILVIFNKKCITVFSASSYSTDLGNCSGVLKIPNGSDEIEFITFPPLSRLKKADASYYKVQAFRTNGKHIPSIHSIHHFQIVLRGNTSNNSQSSFQRTKKPIKYAHSQYPRCLCRPNILTGQRKSQANLLPVPKSISMNRFNPKNLMVPKDDNDKVDTQNEKGTIRRQIVMNRSGSIPDLLHFKDDKNNLDDGEINDSENFTKYN